MRPSMAGTMLQHCADQEGVCLGAYAHFFFASERFTHISLTPHFRAYRERSSHGTWS